ncbi:MAG: F0F1 ATP synthase subunit A [Chloroflexi bacterium]|nr:F0F1 ATP synthase subunit A [Chloroflexota bacterium]
MRNPKVWIAIIALLVVGGVIKTWLTFSVDAVRASVAIAPEILFNLAGFDVTPTIITLIIVMIIIILLAVFSTRNLQLVPGGLQNIMETAIEQLINLFEGIAGPKWRDFFTIAASIFILVIVSNFVGLIPGAGSIGIIKLDEKHPTAPEGIFILGDAPAFIHTTSLFHKNQLAQGVPEQELEEEQALVPILRAPTSDINLPLALALVSVIMTQVYGMRAQGLRYWTRFFSFGRIIRFFADAFKGHFKIGEFFFGLIDAFVGAVELVSELGKIIAFTFRLFGNIFAGEVILLIMAFLFFALPIPFYGLEFFVAFIQAFVFAVLTVAFMRLATAEHGGESHEAQHH